MNFTAVQDITNSPYFTLVHARAYHREVLLENGSIVSAVNDVALPASVNSFHFLGVKKNLRYGSVGNGKLVKQ